MKQSRLIVLGAGISGMGASILAKKKGYNVFLSEAKKISKSNKTTLQKYEIAFEENGHTKELIQSAEIIVKSPGISNSAQILQDIDQKKIISEIEFAYRYAIGKIIAVTGSNGKTTTASLIYHILSKAGFNVALGGNIGFSFAQLVAENSYDYYVLEVSSFQLDHIKTFKPHIAVLLNITPDHLDRYSNQFELYSRAKFNIAKNQDESNFFVYHQDDDVIQSLMTQIHIKANLQPYSTKKPLKKGAYATQQKINIVIPNPFDMNASELSLIGTHNVANSLAAALSANILNIRKDVIKESLADFEAVEHRLEKVLKIGGIQFINDSKATNVNATFYALKSMSAPTIWIAGGTDKGNDYSSLIPLVRKRVEAIVCLGLNNDKILYSFENEVNQILETKKMQDAVRAAFMLSKKGYNILLSPSCASFDLFRNYEDRGTQFKKEVKKL